MRLLQVHNRYRQAGGEDTVVEAEGDLLRRGGHTVELYESVNSGNPFVSGCQMIASPWNPVSAAQARPRFVSSAQTSYTSTTRGSH